VQRLTQRFADRLFGRAAQLYAAKVYGPRLRLPVSAPDSCVLGHHGFIADCEGEFTRRNDPFPKCAEWFTIILAGLHEAPRGSVALVLTSFPGLCHNPNLIYTLIHGFEPQP